MNTQSLSPTEPPSNDDAFNQRAVIFDFGGVFMKTIDYTPRHRWDDRLGLPHGSVEHIVHGSTTWRQVQSGLLSLHDYWSDVAHQLNLTPNETRQLAQDFYSGDQLDVSLVNYARQLRAQGHAVALLSNDSLALLDKLRILHIDDLFDPLVISAAIGVMKPDARAFQHVLDQLHRPAEQTIFVDDMSANVAAATFLGIHAIQYTTLAVLRTALEPLLLI